MKNNTQPARGTRDILPVDAAHRLRILNAIIDTYLQRGFAVIETPAIERIEMLTGGEGGDNEKLVFKIQKRGEDLERAVAAGEPTCDLGLRFDLTVPLTRFYAENQANLPSPFKAIQAGPVWRAERPQKGRYRQFVQCDIDIIGDATIAAELDLIDSSSAALRGIGLETELRLNDRRLLTAVGQRAGIAPDRLERTFIVLDKLDKVGLDGVREELSQNDFSKSQIASLMQIIGEMQQSKTPVLGWSNPTDDELRVVAELQTIAAVSADVSDVKTIFDPSLVRGMGYYTGPIFEFGAAGLPYSVGGGGRYDKLIGKWSGADVPACGASIGFERILDLVTSDAASGPVALLCDASIDDMAAVMKLASQMRTAGNQVAVTTRSGKLGKQLSALAEQRFVGYVLYTSEVGADTKPSIKAFSEVSSA